MTVGANEIGANGYPARSLARETKEGREGNSRLPPPASGLRSTPFGYEGSGSAEGSVMHAANIIAQVRKTHKKVTKILVVSGQPRGGVG